jgi:TRAP-type C4-dicarboxylate transport system substrate-binding protein
MTRAWLIPSVLAVGLVVSLTGCKRDAEKSAESAAGGTAAPATVPATITLTYANFPPAATFPCVQMEQWKQEVEKRTDGKVQVKTFPGSTLLGAKNMYDGVESGAADIGCFAMSYQPGRFPVCEAVDLPLGFTSSRVASLTLNDLLAKRQPKEFEKVHVVTAFTCPPVNLMTSKPAKTLADLKGMQLRAAGTGVDAVKLMGATPVAMPQSDVPDAIQKGVVTGLASSLEVLKDMNYAAYCPYSTRVDANVVTFAVIMNRKKWESLPQDVQKVITDLARPHAEWTGQYVDGHVQEALDWAKKERNHEVIELPADERAKIADLLQPMIDAYVAKTEPADLNRKQLVEEVRAIKQTVEQAASK